VRCAFEEALCGRSAEGGRKVQGRSNLRRTKRNGPFRQAASCLDRPPVKLFPLLRRLCGCDLLESRKVNV